jgi:hypothetical protein
MHTQWQQPNARLAECKSAIIVCYAEGQSAGLQRLPKVGQVYYSWLPSYCLHLHTHWQHCRAYAARCKLLHNRAMHRGNDLAREEMCSV